MNDLRPTTTNLTPLKIEGEKKKKTKRKIAVIVQNLFKNYK